MVDALEEKDVGSSSTLSSPSRTVGAGVKSIRSSPQHMSSPGVTTNGKVLQRQRTTTGSSDLTDAGRKVDARILEARKKLPIWVGRETIIDAVQNNDTVVILGETGSGKTTQIPQYLYEAGLASPPEVSSSKVANGASTKRKTSKKMIGITQPRRVAAISLAKRVAVEMGVPEPDRDERRGKGKNGNRDASPTSASLVGYSIRFDDRSGRQTRIKFMTDGFLLREMLSSDKKGKRRKREEQQNGDHALGGLTDEAQHSLLEQYSVLIIDEAHERSVHTDVVLGLAKRIQRERKKARASWLHRLAEGKLEAEEEGEEPIELKVVIMSATIDAEAFAKFFHTSDNTPAPILYIKGRQFPIKLYHSVESCQNWMQSCKKLIVKINDMAPGDVLIFMTGAEEIESFASELHDLSQGMQVYADGMGKPKPFSLLVVKLYAALGGEAIRKCFLTTPPGCRKIVLATNIAETSITISGIKYVIDCGLAKERTFRTSLGQEPGAVSGASMDMLEVKPISKSAARQRMGRAGREANGCCFRLYKEEIFESLPESTLPEILRTDLSSVVLDVFAMGLNPVEFDWLDRPEEEGLRAAVVNLVELGALEMASDVQGKEKLGGLTLTLLGRQMALLPLLPQLSKTLLSARDCSEAQVFTQALDLVSILSTEKRSILVEPSNRTDDEGGQKREEADRARERLSHPSGDHATQLKALYAYSAMQQSVASGKEGGPASNGQAATTKIKEWCSLNFVSLKSIREAMRIRGQLYRICQKQGWVPASQSCLQMQVDGNSDDSSDSSSDDDLIVTRNGVSNGHHDVATSKDDFGMLRRCLIQGKRVNTAFRQGESSNQYQRAHGGNERFKIHPSSSLLFRKPLPNVIFFEDIFVTTQIFARTVSAAEASWLTDLSGEVKNRRSLHQAALESSNYAK
jgi:HrpA-like RNA helicase